MKKSKFVRSWFVVSRLKYVISHYQVYFVTLVNSDVVLSLWSLALRITTNNYRGALDRKITPLKTWNALTLKSSPATASLSRICLITPAVNRSVQICGNSSRASLRRSSVLNDETSQFTSTWPTQNDTINKRSRADIGGGGA